MTSVKSKKIAAATATAGAKTTCAGCHRNAPAQKAYVGVPSAIDTSSSAQEASVKWSAPPPLHPPPPLAAVLPVEPADTQ